MAQSVDIAIRARDEASRKFGHIGRSATGLSKVLKRVIIAAGAYFGAREIFRFAKESILAFGKQEIAVKHLTDALGNLGITSKDSIKDMQNFAKEIQQVTMIGDEVTLELASMGAAMGKLSGDTLKAATIAAIGLSKAYKIELEGAMRLVARAAAGDTTTLARYGIKLDQTMTKSEQFGQILEIGAKQFSLATGEIDTQEGAMAQLRNTWGDFKETIGEAIGRYIPGFTHSFKIAKVVIENWRLAMEIGWKSAKLGLIDYWEDTKHFFGTAIPDLLLWFGRNWRQIFTDIWNATKAIFTNMYTNIENFFMAIWHWLQGDELDFTWIGLLEGFEFTLQELPEIAKRELSATERELGKELDKLKAEMAKKVIEEFAPKEIDIEKILKNVVLPDIAGAKKKVAKAKGEVALAPEEARLLTFAPGRRFNLTEKNTGDTAKNTSAMAKGIVKVVTKLEDVINAIEANQIIIPASNMT